MEFPFGHHSHNNREEPQIYPPPQPQPYMESQYYPPPPPQVPGVYKISHNTPDNHIESPTYPPPPQPPQLPPYEYHYRPHMPGLMDHQNVNSHANASNNKNEVGVNNLEGYFANKKSYKVYCKAGGNSYCVGIRDGKLVLTYDHPNDPTQIWYKDEKYSTKVKDEDGYPSFALVSKATGKAMKHPISGDPVELIPYKPDHLDASILWTESKDLGSGFRTIRNVNNVRMVLDAFNGDKDHGGVHDGTFLSIFKCWKGDNQNQQWKISPC